MDMYCDMTAKYYMHLDVDKKKKKYCRQDEALVNDEVTYLWNFVSFHLQVFRRHGLEQIVPKLGEKFDPSLQEAMFELPLPEQETGTVAHVIRSGWTLHSRCIRSAQVGVVKN